MARLPCLALFALFRGSMLQIDLNFVLRIRVGNRLILVGDAATARNFVFDSARYFEFWLCLRDDLTFFALLLCQSTHFIKSIHLGTAASTLLSTVRFTSKLGNCMRLTVTGFFGVTCGLIKADTCFCCCLRWPSRARKSFGFFWARWASNSRRIAVSASSSSESGVPQLSLRFFFFFES